MNRLLGPVVDLVLIVMLSACHHRLAPPGDDASELAAWRAEVGPPVIFAAAAGDVTAPITQLIVVSWNVHVGGGRVVELVEWLRRRAAAGGLNAGFVLLLQEAYRAGGEIPPHTPGARVPGTIRPVRPALDVTALGRYLRMSVAYFPSMRNGEGNPGAAGDDREDRGSAILSTDPMTDVEGIELPFGKQRRVAVAATITPRGALPALRVIAAHLDTISQGQRRQADDLARRITELRTSRPSLPLIVGVDANAFFGTRDAVFKRLQTAVQLAPNCDTRSTAAFGRRLDFVFSTLDSSHIRSCETLPEKYGSDHRPIVVTMASAVLDELP